MLVFQKLSSRQGEITVLEGRRVSLGAQNRRQGGPKEDKKRHRKKKKEMRRKEEHQERQKRFQKAVPPFDLTTRVLQVKGGESSLVARGP